MRDAEVDEVRVSMGMVPLAALFDSVKRSAEVGVARMANRVVCIWGVTLVSDSVLTGKVGCAWLLTSDLVTRYPKAFTRQCRAVIEDMFSRWDVLTNAIDCRYSASIRWAKHLGFPLQPPKALGPLGYEFQTFRVRKGDLSWAQQH
jgi:hypothetical protein